MELHVEFRAGMPPRRQLETQLREAIRSGRLRPATSLPASRVLAGELGVSRGVVVDAYSQLTAEGYLSARSGRRHTGGLRRSHPQASCAARGGRATADPLRPAPPRRVAIEDPGWRWQSRTVEHAGLEPLPVRVDEHGLVVSELERVEVDAVAVTPAHQFPTGVVMSPQRRAALIDWARRTDALIVEDDYDAEYRYDREPVAALQGLAPECVAFGATSSKTLAPALRLGWMVLPPHLAADVAREYAVTFAGPSVIEQLAAASFLSSGQLDRHLRRTRRSYRARRDALVGALGEYLPRIRIGGAVAAARDSRAGRCHVLVP